MTATRTVMTTALPSYTIDLAASSYGLNPQPVGTGQVDHGALISNALATMQASYGGGLAHLPSSKVGFYSAYSPIIVPTNVTLRGDIPTNATNTVFGTQIRANASFPHTTTSGSQTTGATKTTTFTLNVASTAGFPLSSGYAGYNPPSGLGVLCVYGCTIYYTGTTSTSFTGCTTNDTSVTIPGSTPLSTFLVWLGDPGQSAQAAASRVERIALIGNTSFNGISIAHSCRLGELGGLFDCAVSSFYNFGFRVETNPSVNTSTSPTNWGSRGLWVTSAPTVDTNAVGIDILDTRPTGFIGQARALEDISIVKSGSGTLAAGISAMRVNGVATSIRNLHMEAWVDGLRIGDKYPTYAHGQVIDASAGTPKVQNNVVYLGANSFCDLSTVVKSQTGGPNLINDQVASATSTEQVVMYYKRGGDGLILTDSSQITNTK